MTMFQLQVLISSFLGRLLGRRIEPVAHLELEHTHWNRATQSWVAHESGGQERLAA